jgi:hypothetical protein
MSFYKYGIGCSHITVTRYEDLGEAQADAQSLIVGAGQVILMDINNDPRRSIVDGVECIEMGNMKLNEDGDAGNRPE